MDANKYQKFRETFPDLSQKTDEELDQLLETGLEIIEEDRILFETKGLMRDHVDAPPEIQNALILAAFMTPDPDATGEDYAFAPEDLVDEEK